MFFIVGITNRSNDLGTRRCRVFPCCGTLGVMAAVTCTFQQFTLFFIPLFRFGKRFFVTCPNCGSVYEMTKSEGQRVARDASAEINPDQIFAVQGANRRICPNCRCAVDPNARYCPNCGTRLL